MIKLTNFLEYIGKIGTAKLFFGGRRDIPRRPNEDYLTRWYLLSTPWLGIYIHRFWASDYSIFHDHPWSFISLVLKGWYKEHLPDNTVVNRTAGSFRFRAAEEFHWIDCQGQPGSCWTLFIRFKPHREWGFWTKNGWVEWFNYDAENQRRKS